jgi:hypothetical protein
MRKGKIIGESDKFVSWHKPKKCPQGLNESEFSALPSTLIVREIYYYIIIPSFRTQRVSLITTLLNTTIYSTLEVLKLYGERWSVELNLKHLKQLWQWMFCVVKLLLWYAKSFMFIDSLTICYAL